MFATTKTLPPAMRFIKKSVRKVLYKFNRSRSLLRDQKIVQDKVPEQIQTVLNKVQQVQENVLNVQENVQEIHDSLTELRCIIASIANPGSAEAACATISTGGENNLGSTTRKVIKALNRSEETISLNDDQKLILLLIKILESVILYIDLDQKENVELVIVLVLLVVVVVVAVVGGGNIKDELKNEIADLKDDVADLKDDVAVKLSTLSDDQQKALAQAVSQAGALTTTSPPPLPQEQVAQPEQKQQTQVVQQ